MPLSHAKAISFCKTRASDTLQHQTMVTHPAGCVRRFRVTRRKLATVTSECAPHYASYFCPCALVTSSTMSTRVAGCMQRTRERTWPAAQREAGCDQQCRRGSPAAVATPSRVGEDIRDGGDGAVVYNLQRCSATAKVHERGAHLHVTGRELLLNVLVRRCGAARLAQPSTPAPNVSDCFWLSSGFSTGKDITL
jgi:hypothetical protein